MQCLSTYSSEANSVGWYDLTGSYFLLEVVSPQGPGTGTTVTYLLCEDSPDSGYNAVQWSIGGTQLRAIRRVNATEEIIWFDGFDTSNHRWLRIREAPRCIKWVWSRRGGLTGVRSFR